MNDGIETALQKQDNQDGITSPVTNEDILGPSKTDLLSIGLSCLGSIAAGFLGGLFTLLFTYVFLGSLQASAIFPYILSLVGFFSVLITVSVTFVLNRLLFTEKYKE